jgi:hypothetical protein
MTDPRIAVLSALSSPGWHPVPEAHGMPWDEAEQLLAAYDASRAAAVPSALAGPAALRDRIAEALYRREWPRKQVWVQALAMDRETFEAMADAVLAVLPEPTDQTAEIANLRTMYDVVSARENDLIEERDQLLEAQSTIRAAAFREAASAIEAEQAREEATEWAQQDELDPETELQGAAVRASAALLRRLAGEAQQPEAPVHGESVAHLAGVVGEAQADVFELPGPDVVAYRNSQRPGVLLCREHGDCWWGLTPLTSDDLPDGGTCTYGDPADPDDVCGRDVLIVDTAGEQQ